MALMKFREPNQVLWRGVRPGHNWTEVYDYSIATNATVVMYTVPAGQTAYFHYFGLDVLSAAAAGYGRINIYNAVPAFVGPMVMIRLAANSLYSECVALTYPLELLAGWSLRLESNAVGLAAAGVILGGVE